MALIRFNAILLLIHVIYDIYSGARRLLNYARQYFEDFYFGPRDLKSELDYIRREKAPFTKPLSHIAVILGGEVVSVKDIVRIALWSHASGASFVSFYDHSGQLKKNKSAVDLALTTECAIKSHIPRTNGYKNGKQFPYIMLFDITDGKAGIVRVARQLCEKALAKEITHHDVSLDFLDKHVLKEAGVPEPELGLYCGDICSMFGFLPWHSRVTEFLPLCSHHNVSVRSFVALLRRFNKCEQRLGT